MNTQFGDWLRKTRIEGGHSQETLAAVSRVSSSFISYIELGKKLPSGDSLVRLLSALRIQGRQAMKARLLCAQDHCTRILNDLDIGHYKATFVPCRRPQSNGA